MGAESSRIKITAAPVIFTARGEVLLMSKGSVSNRDEFTLTSDRSELANESELTSKKDVVRQIAKVLLEVKNIFGT